MKASRFLRQPFVVTGYVVTEDNMDAIAQWCEGHVIRNTEQPFVRVPVNRPANKRQTEAYVGCWVLVSLTHTGERSFKVYTQEWLEKNFLPLPEEMEVDQEDTQEISPATVRRAIERGGNVRAIPVQRHRHAR